MVARTLEEMRASGMDVLVGASPATLADLADYRNWIDPLFREYMMRPGGSSATEQALAVLSSEGGVTLAGVVEPDGGQTPWVPRRTGSSLCGWGAGEGAPRDLPAGFWAGGRGLRRPPPTRRGPSLLALLCDGAGATARIGATSASRWHAAATGRRWAPGAAGFGDCTNLLRAGPPW